MSLDKKADLAGPGIGTYEELEKILPKNYNSILDPNDTQKAIFASKNYIEENLCRELNLMMVQVPLIVDVESGVNDMLDRDGSRTPIQFHISNDHDKHPVDAQVVQAATKWKRVALKEFDMKVGEGLNTATNALRRAGLVPPSFQELESAFLVTIEHRRIASLEDTIVDYLRKNEVVTNKIIRRLSGEGSENKVKKAFQVLRTKGIIEPVDPGVISFKFSYKRGPNFPS